MRKRIFEIIEVTDETDKKSDIYDFIMMVTIIISLVPLVFKKSSAVFMWIDYVSVSVFIIDYILRFLTADFKLKDKGIKAFIAFPFTPMAIIDLVSILPSLTAVSSGFRLLKIIRLIRTFKVFRALKFLRYSKSFLIITDVFKKQKRTLGAVVTMAFAYILVSALVIFNVEPDSFNSFFDAIYWATVSLTTVGYGDIYPVTTVGRLVTMVSSVFGIAIIALPSGIITAGYLEEMNKKD